MELDVLLWIQQNLRSGLADAVMVFFSTIGNVGMVWFAAALPLLFTKRYRWFGIALVLAIAIGYFAGDIVLKNVVARPRPFNEIEGFVLLIPEPHGFSFPSGHTLSSFAAATVLFAANRKFGIPAYAVAALISFSRLYLFVHYPTDVLAGTLFGIGAALLALWIIRRVRHNMLYQQGS